MHAQSESLTVSKTALYLLNKKSNSFLVIDDSTAYFTLKASAKKWQRHPLTFIGSNIRLKQFKELFQPISYSNGRVLFIYKGVGEVYELKNDTIRRIDRSFRHENQFNNSLFEYQNTVYAFGGYGLFTFKNIITYFNNTNREWYELTTSIKPQVRSTQFYQLFQDRLFIFGGGKLECGNVIHYNDCWEFSFTTNRWRKLGQMNSSVFSNSLVNGAVVPDKPLDIIVAFPDIWLVDIFHNQLTHYNSHLTPAIREAYFDQTKQHVLLVKHQKEVMSFQVTNSKKLFRDKLDVTPFYESSNHSEPAVSIYLIVVTLFFLLGGIFLFRFKKKKQEDVADQEVKKIRLHNNQLFIGERLINNDLNLLEFRILMKFIEHKNESIDIIALNELIEDETTSLAAQKKRRETTLKTLREKLAFILDISQENVFLESRDKADKRIKMFLINPDILA
ncbi:MAG: hypothetical protein RLZZ493_1999 [Bacteroidota bacterium]